MFHYSPPLVAAALILAFLPLLTLLTPPLPLPGNSAPTPSSSVVTVAFAPTAHGAALPEAPPLQALCGPGSLEVRYNERTHHRDGLRSLAMIPLGLGRPLLFDTLFGAAPMGATPPPSCPGADERLASYPL